MKFLIFGGTTEGRTLSHKLAECGAEVIVSVATQYGEEEQGFCDGVKVLCGRMDEMQIREAVKAVDVCIDATHPYAVIVTESIRNACTAENIEYIRLLRCKSDTEQDVIYMKNAEQAADWLSERSGNVMLTTGAKELSKFSHAGVERLFPRVLPLHSSIDSCENAGIPHRNIIAMQGPFSIELNIALLKEYNIKYMVTKDGGKNGGFEQKITAARQAGAVIIVLERPEDEGLDYEQTLEKCREMMKCR